MKKLRTGLGAFQHLLDDIHIPTALVRVKTGQIRVINSALEDILGSTRQEVVGKPLTDFFVENLRQRIVSILELAKQVPQFRADEGDCEIYRKSGRRIHVSIKTSTVKIDGRLYLFFSFFDLTLQKRVQKKNEDNLKEMAQVAKLADIGMLAAGVAHELNNPLMIIQGFAENIDLLLEQTDLSREDLKSQTAEILRATDRMTRIISQMSRMVRSTDVHFEVIDMRELVHNVTRFIGHQLKSHKVQITIEIEKPIMVKCDSNQIEQVMLNILNNAIHATSENSGERTIRIKGVTEGDKVLLSFWNNGPAIPEEIQTKIMTPFYTTKEVGKGTGLGLTVSFGIMKAHGGRLTFKSAPNFGTEFLLEFKAESLTLPVVETGNGKAILTIDDDPSALEIIAQKISQFGYQAIRAKSGADAIEQLTKNKSIVAIFTDVRMPDMDGVSLVRHIRQIFNPGPPVYAFTGYSFSKKIEDDLASAGVSKVLTKPLNQRAFTEIMHELSLPLKKSAS